MRKTQIKIAVYLVVVKIHWNNQVIIQARNCPFFEGEITHSLNEKNTHLTGMWLRNQWLINVNIFAVSQQPKTWGLLFPPASTFNI